MSTYRVYTALLLLVLAILSGCSKSTPPAVAAPKVTVAKPVLRTLSDWDDFVGQFEAVKEVAIRSRVNGYLAEIGFTDGTVVKAGDLLFRIDPRPFEAALDQARSHVRSVEAKLNNLRSERDRARGLLSAHAVSQEEFDTLNASALGSESDLAEARAAQRSAELNLEFTRITAPIAGRVSYRRIDVGNTVKADDTLLTTLVSVDPIRFSFQASEAMYLRYKRQNAAAMGTAPVRIRLQDESANAREGRLEFFDNEISAGSGTIRGRALVKNPDGFLVPGMFGHLQLQGTASYDGIQLPDTAVATRGAQRIVYVLGSDNTVSARPIELGPLNGGMRVIRSGLTGEELVIVSGLQRVVPGAKVDATTTTIEVPPQPQGP